MTCHHCKSINEIVEICFGTDVFFRPNCEYISDDLLLIILSEDTLGVNDDGNKSRKRSHIGKSRRRGREEAVDEAEQETDEGVGGEIEKILKKQTKLY